MSTNSKLSGVLLGMALMFSASASMANAADLLTIPIKWNPVERSWSLREVLHDCVKNNEVCGTIVDIAAAYVGVPPGTIKESMRIADALGLGVAYRHPGEEHYYNITVPNGYRACDMSVRNMSAAPASGKYSPTFQAAVHADNHIELYSFVHRMPILRGQGRRSWVDTVVIAQFAKVGTAAAQSCYMAPGKKYVYRCKGASGVNNGLPACRDISLRSMSPYP